MATKFVIGVDLGGTYLKAALIDTRYKIRHKAVLATKGFRRRQDLIKAIIDCATGLIKKNKLSKKDILGLGLGLPGPVDTSSGKVHFFPNIPGWREVNLKRILEKKIRLPVFLDNDANLMSLAEHKIGAAYGTKNAVCLTLGTGVGGGIILQGELYRGSRFSAGEIGHVPINESGPRCNCGGYACLESYVGNQRIAGAAEKSFHKKISLEKLSSLAKAGNAKAKKIWTDTARHLGVAIAGVVNLLNPDCIVIGGGVANAGNILFKQIRQIVKERAMAVPARHVRILKAKLGSDAGLIGAAILVKEAMR